MTPETKTDLKDLLLICLCYTLAHGLMLVNNGIFWDDWWLIGNSPLTIMNAFQAAGYPQFGFLHNILLLMPQPIFIYRLVVFSFFLISAIALHYILKDTIIQDRTARFFIVTFFAIFPVNHARIAMINTPAIVFWLAFAMASLLLFRLKLLGNIILRIMALLLYIVSFSTPSLLVLYIPVLTGGIIVGKNSLKKNIGWFSYILTYSDFLMLPFGFWLVKIIYFKPYGAYQGYNQFGLYGLLHAAKFLPVSLYTSFVEPLVYSFDFFSFTVFLGTILIVAYLRSIHNLRRSIYSHSGKLFIFGLACFFGATFPYLAVNKTPQLFEDWDSRFQLLVPLGASLMLYFGGRMLFDAVRVPRIWQIVIFAMIVTLFIRTNIEFQIMYERDAFKQLSFIENLRKSEFIPDNGILLIDDHTLENNINLRAYRQSEYNEILKVALPEKKLIGIDSNQNNDLAQCSQNIGISSSKYPTPARYLVTINYGVYRLIVPNMVRLKLRQLFTPHEFSKNIEQVVKLTFKKL